MVAQKTTWILTKDNDVYLSHNDRLVMVPGLKIASITADKRAVWALGTDGRLHQRTGVTRERPQGDSWTVVDVADKFPDEVISDIAIGPYQSLLSE